jgi:hypothetical protein
LDTSTRHYKVWQSPEKKLLKVGRLVEERTEDLREEGYFKMADAAAELEEGGMVRTLKDLFAGGAGGIAQVLLGEFEGSKFGTPLLLLLLEKMSSRKVTWRGESGGPPTLHSCSFRVFEQETIHFVLSYTSLLLLSPLLKSTKTQN